MRYRSPKKFRDGGAVLSEADMPPVPPVAIVEIDHNDAPGDDPSVAFQRQIDALRASEECQRAAQAAPAPQSHDKIIRNWQRAGLTDRQAEFLRANPSMVDTPSVLEAATKVAHIAGHQVDSPEYFQAIKALSRPTLGTATRA
jgi:hypothetical protein